jgi:hypothetical protein
MDIQKTVLKLKRRSLIMVCLMGQDDKKINEQATYIIPFGISGQIITPG